MGRDGLPSRRNMMCKDPVEGASTPVQGLHRRPLCLEHSQLWDVRYRQINWWKPYNARLRWPYPPFPFPLQVTTTRIPHIQKTGFVHVTYQLSPLISITTEHSLLLVTSSATGNFNVSHFIHLLHYGISYFPNIATAMVLV